MPLEKNSTMNQCVNLKTKASLGVIPSEFLKNSGRKKNSGMSSFTSVVESELVSRHVVCKE
jgi:hypothetical protein